MSCEQGVGGPRAFNTKSMEVIPKEAKVLWQASTVLQPSDEAIIGNGFSESSYLDDGTFVQKIRVNLIPPKDGGSFEAWLLRGDPENLVSLGILESPNDDGSYVLESRLEEDLRDHTKVTITWLPPNATHAAAPELSDLDLVMEGSLRVVQDSGE
jgi:hypothetical protein